MGDEPTREVGSAETPDIAPRASFDVGAARRQFPALSQRLGDAPLSYLDNAATTQKPERVLEAVTRSLTELCAGVHRGTGRLGSRANQAYAEARAVVARLLGASPSEVVFTAGCTDGLNWLAHALEPRIGPGDEVAVSALEHHSNFLPWQALARRRGARLIVLPLSASGLIDLERAASLLTARTRVLAISHVSNVTGQRQPAAELTALAHAVGASVIVDGAQAAPHGPVGVKALGCDAYALSGHKIYGPFGIGALYLNAEWAKHLEPPRQGGGMVAQVGHGAEHEGRAGSTFLPPPRRFEAGTPNLTGALGLAAAIEFCTEIGWEAIARHERALAQYAAGSLGAVGGVRVLGCGASEALCSFTVEGLHPHDVATFLDADGVQVRAGQLCAQPLMRALGTAAVVRASFALYNTRQEVDRLVEGVRRAQRTLGRR